MALLEKKFDADLFKDIDLEFLNNIPDIEKKLDEDLHLLISKKNAFYESLGNKNNNTNTSLNKAEIYLKKTKKLLENVYQKIEDFALIKIELNTIEKNLITIIESFNVLSSFDNTILENTKKKIPKLLNEPIEDFKEKYYKLEDRI